MTDLTAKRALVTGCAGFIGSTLAARLLVDGWEVIGVDAFKPNYDRWIKERNLESIIDHPRFDFREEDLLHSDWDALLQGVHAVFHQAAIPGVRTSWGLDFQAYVDNNILVTQRLLEAVRRSQVQKVVCASSSSVYGNMSGPTDERRLPQPFSPYGVTKLSAEQLCQLYAHNFAVPVVSLRYFTVYGPRQRPDMAFHKFILHILQDRPLTLYGDGEQSRDFTFIDDIVEANLAAYQAPCSGEVYNIGGTQRLTVNQVIRLIEQHTGKTAKILHLPAEPGDPRHTCAHIGKARRELNYNPHFDFEFGLYLQIRDIQALYNL